jgi:hypothetical protein
MDLIAGFIGDMLRAPNDEEIKSRVSRQVLELCGRFPVPGLDRAAS